MEHTVSATEARAHFGEIIRRANRDQQTIIVERDGKPCVVVISVDEYRRLKAGEASRAWRESLLAIRQLRSEINAHRTEPLTPPEDVIRKMREERSERITGLRRR